MIRVRYHPAAERELLHEISYLESREAGLGRRFLTEVHRAEKLVQQFPRSAREILPGVHKRLLRTFPYSLIYSLEEDTCVILAIAHHSQRPGYWTKRQSPRPNESKEDPREPN